MTALQIRRKLDKAGIRTNSMSRVQIIMNDDRAPEGWRVLIRCRRDEIEIFVKDRDGDSDRDMVDISRHLVERAIGSRMGGYRTGYGSWVCQVNCPVPSATRDLIAENRD